MSKNNAAEFFESWPAKMGKVKSAAGDTVKAFGAMFGAIMKEGALTVREKELVALGAALTVRCDPCINLHIQKCLEAGATPEQIVEAATVVVMMQGGPGFTYLPKVIDALEALGKAPATTAH